MITHLHLWEKFSSGVLEERSGASRMDVGVHRCTLYMYICSSEDI